MIEQNKIDISVNIIMHSEGIVGYKTLRSIMSNVQYAQQQKLRLEINISLDRPNQETYDVVANFRRMYKDKLSIKAYTYDYGDASMSRNALIEKSRGQYIALFDGDDLFTENFVYDAYTMASKNKDLAIYSPRYLIVFEDDHYLVEKHDRNNFLDIDRNLIETNYYISQFLAHRDVFSKVSFTPNGDCYGMEDWHFNCQATAFGIPFYNVPDTIFFYRRKKIGSMLTTHTQTHSIIRPSMLFEPRTYASLICEKRAVVTSRHVRSKNNIMLKLLKRHPFAIYYLKTLYFVNIHLLQVIKKKLFLAREAPATNGDIPTRLMSIGMTQKAIHMWGKVNQYEPMIRASKDMLEHIPIVNYPTESILSDIYYDFCKQHTNTLFTDVVLVPHLTRGGADLAAINLIRELNHMTKEKVLVISTADLESPWSDKIAHLENTVFVEGLQQFRGLKEDDRITFIIKIIQHWGVKRLTIVNSEVGYKIISRYTKAIKDVGCTTYLHTYAFNMTDDGYRYNQLPNALVDAYRGVNMFIVDSSAYKQELVEINGFDKNKISVLYSALASVGSFKTSYVRTNRIIWASRVCDDKLVKVLIEVGRLLQRYNIRLDIYGTIDQNYLEDNRFLSMIKDYSNIAYKGAYESFVDLELDAYDMLLFTTKNEGMPFVALEAIRAKIFIIAPAVGGLTEIIQDTKNGLYVAEKLNPQSYVATIMQAYDKHYFTNFQSITNSNQKILKRHSLKSYHDSVNRIMSVNNNSN